ncbi:MAG: hypothetical protein H8D23_11650 [Candidatus Brocadiales bacterium]|nr:hypothetical protein [Candidatus Brocadiales bacterium]
MTLDPSSDLKSREYRRIKSWRDENPDKIRQYNREYYLRKKNGLVETKYTGDDACSCGGKLVFLKKVSDDYLMRCKNCMKTKVVNDG